MRALLGFFTGLAAIALSIAALIMAVHLQGAATKSQVDAFLFQSADWRQQNWVEAPTKLEKMSPDYMRNMLISAFVAEYFKVVPVDDEPQDRTGATATLPIMASKGVMARWKQNVKPELEKMTSARFRRIAMAETDKISKQGDYLLVPFKMKTWAGPNLLDTPPTIEDGPELYIKVRFVNGVRETMGGSAFQAGEWLDRGLPTVAIFKFIVEEVMIK